MPSRDPSRPNIVFFLSDDQGYWAMGCAGNPEIKTPNLDRLAATGTRFASFFCASPVCSPARASILTGRIPSQHGILDFLRAGNYRGESEETGEPIEYLQGLTAYTDIMAGNDYVCGHSGKWHLGASHLPQKSFSFWDVHVTGSGAYYNAPMVRDGVLYRDPRYVSDLITDNALGFLDGQLGSEAPVYLDVHYTAPHAPWGREEHPQDLYDDYFQDCPLESTPFTPIHHNQLYKHKQIGRTEEERRVVLSGYFAAVTGMDRNIGRVLDWLEANDLRENTLVVFTSDNGMSMGHHGIYGKGNGTFPVNMYDTAVKVPAIISQPTRVPEGLVSDALLSHYDLMPTLLEYVGQVNPEAMNLPGRSFAPLLQGKPFDGDSRVVVYDEYGPTRMIRTRDLKYVHRYPYGPHEFYDLAYDPEETTNLATSAAHRADLESLRAEMESWFVRYVDPSMDGTHEAVMGRGQVDIVGPAAEGRQRFGHDVVFARDVWDSGRP